MATKRPTYSSWSAIILLVGLAIVTCGGGGADACGCDRLCPQAASAGTSRSRIVGRRTDFNGGKSVGIKLIILVVLLPGSPVARRDREVARLRIIDIDDVRHKSVSRRASTGCLSAQVYLRLDGRIYTFVNGNQSMSYRRPGLQGMHDEADDSWPRRSRPPGGTRGGLSSRSGDEPCGSARQTVLPVTTQDHGQRSRTAPAGAGATRRVESPPGWAGQEDVGL